MPRITNKRKKRRPIRTPKEDGGSAYAPACRKADRPAAVLPEWGKTITGGLTAFFVASAGWSCGASPIRAQPAIGERAGADTAALGTGAELDTARAGAAPYEEHERLRDWPTRGGRVQDHRNSRAGPLPRPYKSFQGKIEKSEIGQRITMDQADRERDVP